MKKDKIILFDWGNIVDDNLTNDFDISALTNILKSLGSNNYDNIYQRLDKYHGTSPNALSSIEDLKEYYLFLKDEFNLKGTYFDFIKSYITFFSTAPYFKEVAEFEYSLKDKCMVGILSNLNILDYERISKQLDLDKYDYVFLSYEIGLVKPHEDIYSFVQRKVNLKPENILFFDDLSANVLTPKKMGWQTYQVTGLELDKIKDICEKFLK